MLWKRTTQLQQRRTFRKTRNWGASVTSADTAKWDASATGMECADPLWKLQNVSLERRRRVRAKVK